MCIISSSIFRTFIILTSSSRDFNVNFLRLSLVYSNSIFNAGGLRVPEIFLRYRTQWVSVFVTTYTNSGMPACRVTKPTVRGDKSFEQKIGTPECFARKVLGLSDSLIWAIKLVRRSLWWNVGIWMIVAPVLSGDWRRGELENMLRRVDETACVESKFRFFTVLWKWNTGHIVGY